MKQEETYMGRPIYSLQTMLRELSYHFPEINPVIPNGIFGEETLEAVMRFQKNFHPPVTGIVDNGTWDAIVNMYHTSEFLYGPPPQLRVWPDLGMTVEPKKSAPQMYVLQGVYTALANMVENIEPTEFNGILEGATERNTRAIQRLGGLPETGAMDRATLEMLNRLYHTFLSGAPEEETGPCG